MLGLSNAFTSYLDVYGYSSFSFVNTNELELKAGPYTVDYYGTFSDTFSSVSKVIMYDSANNTSGTESGTFDYAGFPLLSALESGSTMTAATDLLPNPVTPSSDLTAAALLSCSWNGSYWSGTTDGYSEAISDTGTGRMVQINILENPTSISYAGNTATTTGFLSVSVPLVNGVGIQVSNYLTGNVTDSLLVTGVSYAANLISASQAIPTAIAGNDTVSITGSGSMNVIDALVKASAVVSSVTLHDSATNVQSNLDSLEILATENKLASISLTDLGTPTITLSPSQSTADAQALARIVTPYDQAVALSTPCYVTGTHIATDQGDTMVQFLRAGDRVQLAGGGTASIVWVGQRRVNCQRHACPMDVQPVLIAAHAFGLSRPARDLRVSPDHAVFVEGVLIPIRYLLNGATVRQENVAAVTYWHVELAEHSVLLAEGMPAESYLDTGNRGAFDNGGTVVTAHPDFSRRIWAARGCAPLVMGGPVRDLVHRRLTVQAFALGWRQLSVGGDATQWLPPESETVASESVKHIA
jgi:hypothetical protein